MRIFSWQQGLACRLITPHQTEMKLVLSHPTANSNVRALAAKLAKENMLYEFDTTIAFFEDDIWQRLKNIGPLADLQRRSFDLGIKQYTRTHPLREAGRMLASKAGLNFLTKHEKGLFSIDAVYRSLDNRVAARLPNAARHGAAGVYAYEDGALASFTQAKISGLKCIYDLPIAYWELTRKLIAEEAARLPHWAKTLGGGIIDSSKKIELKTRELELADIVVVPSKFVKESLPAWAVNKKIIVAPFGTPVQNRHDAIRPKNGIKNANKPLRVLFVGSMTQRKGLADLFSAVKLLHRSDVELVVMGSLQAPLQFYRNELSNFTYEAGRANAQVLELMRTCDVLCLPSIAEGRALVMQEAMSQGLPIIITSNTGGADLIIETETGFLVPIRSPESIAAKIQWFLDNRSIIPHMGENAKLHAQKYTWESYGDEIVKGIV